MRANAAMLIGFLLGNIDVEDRRDITREHVCQGERASRVRPSVAILCEPAPFRASSQPLSEPLLYHRMTLVPPRVQS